MFCVVPKCRVGVFLCYSNRLIHKEAVTKRLRPNSIENERGRKRKREGEHMISPLIETPFVDNKSICFDIRLGAVRGLPLSTYANFSAFLTPPLPPCTQIHATSLTEP